MSTFRARARQEIETRPPALTLTPVMRNLCRNSAATLARVARPDARQRATAARARAVANLERFHAQLKERLEARGVGYHRAATASEARQTVSRLLGDARRIAKSKSMVAEEVHLTPHLRAEGREVLETDIGEYIVDIEGRGPSHILAPALHLNRARIREVLSRTAGGAGLDSDDPSLLSKHVRDAVAEFFGGCEASITGVNLAIASSGRLVLVENEGNIFLGVSRPSLHVAVTGLEKVVADEEDALAVLEVLAPSVTAQPLAAFTHFLADPAAGQERHVVFVDNGRSRIAGDEAYRDVLRCIRCGACMNACPVYRHAGGHAYGSVYMGPIGAVLAPLLDESGAHDDLPFASSLCGACTEVCPVGIPLHEMLLRLRARAVQRGTTKGWTGGLPWRAWSLVMGRPRLARAVTSAARAVLAAGADRLPLPGWSAVHRRLPVRPTRDPAALVGTGPASPLSEAPGTAPAADLAALFVERATAVGAAVGEADPRTGDLRLEAQAAVARTGSVLICCAPADRRAFLAAERLVVAVDPATIVEYAGDLAPYLGDSDALILTGTSRTADVEMQIVRGIHGPQAMVIEIRQG